MSVGINPIDLYNALTPSQKAEIHRELLKSMTPCQRLGHKFKSAGLHVRWFRPPQEKLFCTQCGNFMYVDILR